MRQRKLGQERDRLRQRRHQPAAPAAGAARAAEAGPAPDGAERSREAARPASAPARPTCVAPGKPDASQFPKLKQYNGGEPYFDAITNAHIDLIAHAFACDVTRFATLYMDDLSYAGNPLGLPADNHGNVAHTYNGSPVGSDGHPSGAGDPATWALLAKFNRYAYSQGRAADAEARPSWASLDNVLIYASSDMGNPALHSTRNVPTVLAGGANGKFRMGRRIKVPRRLPDQQPLVQPRRRRSSARPAPTTTCWSRSRRPSASPSTASARRPIRRSPPGALAGLRADRATPEAARSVPCCARCC